MTERTSQQPLESSGASVVWSQLRARRSGMLALLFIALLAHAALLAPLIAHDVPFRYERDGAVSYPWFKQMLCFEFQHDHVFNLAMLLYLPALALWALLRRRLAPRQRGRALRRYLLLLAALLVTLCWATRGGPLTPARELSARYQRSAGWFAPIPYSYRTPDKGAVASPPGSPEGHGDHILGTDGGGRDVAARLLYGARIALTIGVIGVAIYITIGTLIGAAAGYFGGAVDLVISRFIEVMITFPSFFLILVLVGVLREHEQLRDIPKIFVIMGVIGITSWTGVARLIRGEFLKLRSREYVIAARALGLSHSRVALGHILPNAIAPALVAATFGVAGAILTESGLSFLGIGIDAPAASWGRMVRVGYDNTRWWWVLWPPSLLIFSTVTAYNVFGESLRDALDPRLRR